MTVVTEKKEKNQSVELCRLAAAIAVVFLHTPVPEPLGGWINCLARFAVPFFFMVSGYYSLNRDSDWVKQRLIRVLKLNLYASVLYCLWKYRKIQGSVLAFLHEQVFRKGILMDWLLRHINPMAGHLWFLAALVPCYFGLWLYVRFRKGKDNRPLYLMGFFLMWVYFALAFLLPVSGVTIPYETCRNGWFLGLPLFLMGMFLHEHEKTIVEKFHLTTRKLVLLTLAGLLLSLMQWRSYGTSEIFLGTIPEMIGLMLLLTAHPVLPGKHLKRITPRLGRISTVIYVIHMLLLEAYERNLLPWTEGFLGPWEVWLRPVFIAAASLAVAVAWDWLLSRIPKFKRV